MRTSSIATRGEIDSERQAWATAAVPSSSLPTAAVVPSSSLPAAAADTSSTSPESKSTRPTRSGGFRIGGGGMRAEESTGEWLLRALREVRGRIKTGGLDLDDDVISGLVSYCEMAPPEDAQEYLINIVGQEAGESVIAEYMRMRGHLLQNESVSNVQKLQAYMKQPAELNSSVGARKQGRTYQKEASVIQNSKNTTENTDMKVENKTNPGTSRRKKSGKAISLADATKGVVVFQQGKPCSCQARRHRLVSNCLSCGKIVCEQEGEGPCSFCSALVLKEGSTYAGLEDSLLPQSEAEVAAEAFAKRLVEYDRNSAARTNVIDDQSDYYEIDGNSWLSTEEKELLRKKQQEVEDADRARRSKVVVTFDLVGRKVIMNEDEAQEIEAENRILRPQEEREMNRIKPNPTVTFQPVFVEAGLQRNFTRVKPSTTRQSGLCLEISGRVQHDKNDFQLLSSDGLQENGDNWKRPLLNKGSSPTKGDNDECYLDYP